MRQVFILQDVLTAWLQTTLISLKLFCIYSVLPASFLTCMMSSHSHACLTIYPIPPNIQYSSLPDICSPQLTKLTSDLQVCGPSMSTPFDFFLSVWVLWAEKEFRGFTSSKDTCVSLQLCCALKAGDKDSCASAGEKGRMSPNCHQIVAAQKNWHWFEERDNLARAVILLLLCQVWEQILPFCDLWVMRVFVHGQSAIGNTHTREREQAMGRCFGWGGSYRFVFRTLVYSWSHSFLSACLRNKLAMEVSLIVKTFKASVCIFLCW